MDSFLLQVLRKSLENVTFEVFTVTQFVAWSSNQLPGLLEIRNPELWNASIDEYLGIGKED